MNIYIRMAASSAAGPSRELRSSSWEGLSKVVEQEGIGRLAGFVLVCICIWYVWAQGTNGSLGPGMFRLCRAWDAASKITLHPQGVAQATCRQHPKVPFFDSVLSGLLCWRWVVPRVLTVRTRRIGSVGMPSDSYGLVQGNLIEVRGSPLGAFPCWALGEPRRG